MTERVRAIAIDPDGRLLTIKRIKTGQSPYWVLPGGAREPEDASLEDALLRELREEVAGDAEILALAHVLSVGDERQYFYVARIRSYDFNQRTGPEFTEEGRGRYVLQPVPLTVDGLDAIDLKPPQIAAFLRKGVDAGFDLLALPGVVDQGGRGRVHA
ncbi:NUDIX domain-containing protein [Nonomuraea sp. PA05]|uniref:NUDIX domain-containing protein n=1 Tax=Nonomuraea sp. PA05 TaxID=2604466 RepID=UPI0011D6C39A|nr:NUDIX domain-containing protein [Nonomuraea sp. PA05]TYB63289.1 NUDIX domain-containing protein [Nonomuraea sp. PA05]